MTVSFTRLTRRMWSGGTVRCVLFAVILNLLATHGTWAQDRSEMPLFLVEGNRYLRQTFNPRGDREARQVMVVSRLSRTGDQMEIQVALYNDEGTGQTTDTLRTTVRCREQDANMVMNVLALVPPEGRRVAVRVTGGEILYPRRPAATDTLQDVSLEAHVEQGVLGFLGSKSRIYLQDRVVQTDAQAPSRQHPVPYTVSEVLRVTFYVLGIKVRERNYKAEEIIDPARGLLRQVLKAPDGSSVTLERTD